MLLMVTVHELLEKLGRDRVRTALGVSASQLSNAVADNSIPSGWYVCVRDLCHAELLDVPDHLFTKMRRGGEVVPSRA